MDGFALDARLSHIYSFTFHAVTCYNGPCPLCRSRPYLTTLEFHESYPAGLEEFAATVPKIQGLRQITYTMTTWLST